MYNRRSSPRKPGTEAKRLPRFMMPDGSGPVPRNHAITIEPPPPKPTYKYKVPGPRSLYPRGRVWSKINRCSQDEAHSWELVKEGPDVAVSQLSSESSPLYLSEEEKKSSEESN